MNVDARAEHAGSGRFHPRQGSILAGCLIAAAVFLVVMILLAIYAALNWKTWATSAMQQVTVAAVNDSPLPAEQKEAIIARVNQVTTDWKEGNITNEQFGRVIQELVDGPVFKMAMIDAAERQYINPSAMTDQEKDEARRTLQRFGRGVVEKKISEEQVQEVLALISYEDASGNQQLKKNLTEEELQAFLAEMKSQADEAEIPDEPYTIDYAEELDKAVLRGLRVEAEDPAMEQAEAPAQEGEPLEGASIE